MARARKFHRTKNQRQAFFKNLAVALIMNGKIKTTIARAKELRAVVDRLVAYGKKHPSEARKFLPKAAAQKLIKEIAPRFKERGGGYTRIIKLQSRRADAASTAFIEFV